MPERKESWEERFDEQFPDVLAFSSDRNFVDISSVVQEFIRTEITAAEKRKVAEIREEVEKLRVPNTKAHEYNHAIDCVLSLL